MRFAIPIAAMLLAAVTSFGNFTLGQQPGPAAIVGFPPVLEKLDLTADQRNQIEAIVKKQDALFVAAWQDFSRCYQQTLKAEAVLLAAIEDNFTTDQRQQAHVEREKTIATTAAPAPTANTAANNTATAKAESAPTGVPLTPEQVAATGKLQEKYHIHLGPLARDAQHCHNRLLSIEMEKFLEIQKVLTRDQLTKLSQLLQSGEAAKIAGMARTQGN